MTTDLLLAATTLALLADRASAQGWSDDFDSYPHGHVLDPGGTASGGNNWESWSSGLASSIVVGQAPAPRAYSGPNSMWNPPGNCTVNNFNRQAQHPTSGQWVFRGMVQAQSDYENLSWFEMYSGYVFDGPWNLSVLFRFDGDTDLVICDCANQNDPAGPPQLVRDVWVPFRVEIDLDGDLVDVFYDGVSLTANQGYAWTVGPFGSSNGQLEIQAINFWPQALPVQNGLYYDDLELSPAAGELGVGDAQCVPNPNSTGAVALVHLTGAGVAGEPVRGDVADGPPGEFGYFISGPNSGAYVVPPGSAGVLCVTGPQYRYTSQVFQFDANGAAHVPGGGPAVLPTDGSFPPVPAVSVGEARAFQGWYRDGAAGSNFTGSVVVQF